MPDTTTSTHHHHILRLPAVMARTGMGRSWIYKEVATGRFPAPAKIGRASSWDATAIDRWLEDLFANEPGLTTADRDC